MTDQGFDYTAARRALKERNQVAALEQVKTQTNDPYVKSEIDNRIEEATPLGFGEGWGRTMLGQERGAGDFAPFLSSANQFRQLKRLEAALDRASANRASEDDVNLIRQFYDEQTKPKTFGYDVGRIAAEALPFAGEFFLTRGAFGRLAKAGSAAKQASLLGRARTLMAGMAQPFQRYGRYAKEIATKRPVLGNTLLALGYEAPKQYIGQTVIGETLGGSRTRASAYTNYIANRYGIQAKGDYGVAVRVADDSYGMWTNALPAAVLDNYIELFSEAMGEALVHLPAAIKLTLMGDVGEAARRGAMKEVANNRLLSFLGLSPDPRYTKLWSDFGFQGLVPELGEEFVGAMTRDVVHQVAPQLAEGGNTQHLIENLPAVALGMGLGMFGPASVSSGLARMDYYVATADMDKETLEKVKALKKYAEAEGLQVMGRDLVQIAKIIDAGPTAAGSGALAADEFIRGKWMNSERVRNDALGRIGRRAEQNRERPDTSMEAVEEEMLAMLQEAMSLPFESQSQMGDRSPMLERLKELEIINAEEATDLERRFNARLAKLRKAFDEGKLADVAELAGDTEAKSMLAEMESRGINTSRQPIGFAAAAWQTRDALKQKLVEGVSRSPEGDIYINTQARDALAALTTREALSPQARRRVGEMDLVGVEEVQEQLAAREALVRELARSLPEYRFEADLRRPTPALARLQQQAGLAVVQFRGSKGAPVAQWDKENKVLFIDQSKIEAKAEELDMEVDELVGEVVLHEMIHVHVQRLGERGEEWLQELDEVLTQAGFPAESVSDKLNSGLYANLTDMARLEESVAFRVQPFGRMLATQPEQAEAQMPLYRRVFKWVFDELMMWLQPRSFYMKQFLKQRDMLENAGIDISDMSNSQVAIALSTAQHLGEVLQIAQRAEGAVFKSTRELEKMLGTVEEDIEVVPLAEFIPSVEETLAEDIPSNPALEDVVEQIPVTQEEFNFEQEVPQEDRTEPVAEQQLNAIQGAIETARRAELIPMLEEDLGVPLQREDGKQPRVAQLRRAMLVRLGLLELDGPKLRRLSEAVGADLSAPRAVEPVREEAPQEPAERPAEAVDEEAPQVVDEETPPPVAEGMAALGVALAPEPAPEPAAEPAPEPAPEPAAAEVDEGKPTLFDALGNELPEDFDPGTRVFGPVLSDVEMRKIERIVEMAVDPSLDYVKRLRGETLNVNRGKNKRTQLSFGAKYEYGFRDRAKGVYDDIVPVEPMPRFMQVIIDRMIEAGQITEDERPNSALINIYEQGQSWIPPHNDLAGDKTKARFTEPIISIRFGSDSHMTFGFDNEYETSPSGRRRQKEPTTKNRAQRGLTPYIVGLPRGSVLVMRGDSATKYNHSIMREHTHAGRSFSITLRRVDFGVDTPQLAPEGTPSVLDQISADLSSGGAQKINVWWGANQNRLLSNLAETPFLLDGRRYRSVEHYYQSNKSGRFDQDVYSKYAALESVAGEKIQGKLGTDTSTSEQVMRRALRAKFAQSEEAQEALLATGDVRLTHEGGKRDYWTEAFPRLLTEQRTALTPALPEAVPVPVAGRKWQIKIISGGQTGADTVGLETARALGIETGGYIGADYLREDDGKRTGQQVARRFGLTTTSTREKEGYRERTIFNAQAADGTVLFGNPSSPGSLTTLGAVAQRNKPYPIVNPTAEQLANWMIVNDIHVLNVAGNRRSTIEGDAESQMAAWRETLTEALAIVERHGYDATNKAKWFGLNREVETSDQVRAELLREDVNDNLSEVGVKVAGSYDADTEYRYQIDQIDPDTGRRFVGAVQVLPSPALPRYMLHRARLEMEVKKRTVKGKTFEVAAVVPGQTVLTTQRLRETDDPGLRAVTIISDELDGTLRVRPVGQKVGSFRISKAQLYDPGTALRLDGQVPLFDAYGNKVPGTEPEGYVPYEEGEADSTGYLRWVRVSDGVVAARIDLDARGVGLSLLDDVERLGRAASASTAVDAGLAPLGVKPQLDIKPKEPGDQDEEKTPPPKRPKLIDPIKQEARAKFWQAIGDMIGVDPALADELISIRFPKDAEGKVTPKVVWNAEKANTLLREREKAEDAEEGQTLREAALGEAAESGAVVEYMLQPIEDVIGQVFNTGEIAVIDSRMEELGEDSIEFELLKMLRDSFRQVGLLGSEETVRGTVAAPRTAAEPEAVEPDDSDDEAQTIEMRQLPQYAAAPSEQVMGAISKKDLNAVVGRYLVNVLAASGTIAQNAERQRNMLNSGQLELWPGSPIMRRQSPWWQRFFVLTGGRDSALLSVLSTAAVYTPRPADEMDMPRSRTITNNEALRSSALVRAISLVGSVGSGIVAQGNIQQLPLAAMSSATAESLLSQLFKSSASHAFDDVDLERVRHMLSGDWSALVRTYQGQKGYKALSAWLEQYRDTMLRVAAKETNEKTAGTPEATKERMAAIKKLRSLPIIREAKSQAAMDLYEAIVGVDLAITQAQFAGTGVNDALRIQDDARAGAGLTTALAGITTNVAESLIATINDEVTQLIDVREALKEGKVGLADRLLRRLHEQAPLLRMATGSQVQLTMTSALPESLYKAARGLALRGADQPRQAFDSARVEIGGVTMLYAINPMVVHHNGSPAKAGTLANDFALMRALLLEERNHRTQVMHDAVMQELEGTTSMAEVRSAVNRVMDLAVKGGSVSKEYADNMANALVGRLVDEMQRPANVRNLSVAVFAALQKRGHVDIKANRQRTRISFVSELDSNRRLDVTVRPQEVQIADNIRMQRIYVYRLDTSGIPAEDVETKRKLVAYAVKHIRDVHKISNAQPETEHKDAYAIELSPELMAEEAIYKDLIRKDSEAFMDLGFGQVIDPTSIKGNFKAMPKNKAELRRFMSDPFYDDMEGMRSGLPYNGRGTSGFEIPEMWDLDRMPKGADDDWSSTAFLLAYDEWLRQLNRESYDANLSMAEFHNAIEKFVDDEGITGLQKWQRFDEINQAMLAAIDVYSWLTDGGWNYAKKLGYATNTTPRPTTFDGWIAFIEERKADQDRRLADGQKLREGEERLVGLGSDTRKILDIARKIHRGQGKWRALGFEEARLARVVVLPGREGAGYGEGFEGGLAAAMISKAAETTRRAWQGQLIRSKQDVYISLLWKDEEDRPMFEDANYGVQEPTAAGGPAKTGVGYRAKRRTILGYVHGSMMGRKLVRTGAVESWHRTTRNVNEALMNNAYIESLKAIGAIVKAPKTGVPGGYKRLEVKSIAGLQGYMAKEWIAKYLKNSLTQYGVKDIENPIYRNYMRLTIAAKHIMLMFGFFHHQAFLRSYLFTVRRSDAMPGGAKQMFRELGQIGLASGLSYLRAFGLVSQERLETVAQKFTPYRTGSQYIADRHVDLELGQQEGLTIQKGNEVVGGGMSGAAYDPDDKEAADQWVRKAFDRIAGWSMSEDRKQRAYQFVENFRRVQFETAAWLFNSMGANLKAAAYMSYFDELRMQNFERLKLDTDGSFLRSLARKAAMKTNADFGGLNLKAREGKASDIFGDGGPRDPKVQMALRALILAPDWTESNLVTVLNTVKTGNILGEPAEMERIEKNMYRHMWLRVGSRALAIQFIINMLLAGIDPDRDLYDLYEEAGFFGKVDDNTPKWSKFRWLDVNASLFSPTESRKFVSVFGHFGDPLKWTADFFNDSPIAPLDRKGSVAARMVVETITGADYSGRRFTTWREIMGIDYDAGVYQRKTTLKDGTVMMPGDSKAGKYAGKLSRFSTKTGAVSLEQVLGGGYLWTQLFKFMPLQGRAAIEFVTGQKDAFDFMMELTGTKYGRTYPK